jgi:hypothetical protein
MVDKKIIFLLHLLLFQHDYQVLICCYIFYFFQKIYCWIYSLAFLFDLSFCRIIHFTSLAIQLRYFHISYLSLTLRYRIFRKIHENLSAIDHQSIEIALI